MATLYGRRWAKARASYLAENPYCVYCEGEGRPYQRGNVVDHIQPHRGDAVLFWNIDNWQTLCKQHHDGAKQAEEKGGGRRGCNIEGIPLDPEHHWIK